MELLDYHFADEKVRTMAVGRLSKLTNDEILIFLLQLVQVIYMYMYNTCTFKTVINFGNLHLSGYNCIHVNMYTYIVP